MPALFVFRDGAIVQPAVTMPGHFMPGGAQRLADCRGEFQCPADGERRQWQTPGGEQLEDAPHPGARAVLVQALDA
ncbi:hypothetical protein D3C81_1986740 [compost metagenome]